MVILRKTLLLIALVLTTNLFGQSVGTDFDKKIIYTDSLNLPHNVSASLLVTLLPELLQRPGNYIMSNYDVKIEGMSVGSAADVALMEMQILDIEKIEVTESPVSSYQNNGQGGSINLVLRSSGSRNDKQWGSAGFLASSSTDVAPQLNVGFKSDKFMLRGIVLGELNDTNGDTQTLQYDDDAFVSHGNINVDKKFRTQLARVYMQYAPTKCDMIKLDVSEIYMNTHKREITDFDINMPVVQRNKMLKLQTHVNYKHDTGRNAFTAEMEYAHTPSSKNNSYTDIYKYRNEVSMNTLSGKLEYKSKLFNKKTDTGCKRQGELMLGMNFNAALGSETAYIDDCRATVGEIVREIPQNDTHYLMPYLTFKSTIGRFGVKASGEFQHFKYNYNYIDKPYSATSNSFTGKIMTEWHFSEMRTLRFIFDRKLQRPTTDQIFPYRTFDIGRLDYVEGNPNLKPMMVHEAMIDYIGTYKLSNIESLVFNAGVSYNRVTDIISSKVVQGVPDNSLGKIQQYLTFDNYGNSKIASANIMALYSYKAFSLSFAGNLYHKMLDDNDAKKHYTYCNLSIFPYFRLKDGWHGGTRVMYYSRVNQRDASLGDCAVAETMVGKEMNRFFIYLSERVNIIENTKDIIASGSKRTEKKYKMMSNYIGICMKYFF